MKACSSSVIDLLRHSHTQPAVSVLGLQGELEDLSGWRRTNFTTRQTIKICTVQWHVVYGSVFNVNNTKPTTMML